MLDRLRRGEQASVKGGRTLELLHDLLAFVDDVIDGVASFAFHRLVDDLENLLEPLDRPVARVLQPSWPLKTACMFWRSRLMRLQRMSRSVLPDR